MKLKGDVFTAYGVDFQVDRMEKHELQYVAENLYEKEGFEQPDQFVEIWKEIHPCKGWQPQQVVWVHFFHRCKEK